MFKVFLRSNCSRSLNGLIHLQTRNITQVSKLPTLKGVPKWWQGKEVNIFHHPEPTTFVRMLFAGAAMQVVFWGNVSYLAWNYMRVKKEDSEEYDLAPIHIRAAASAGLAGLGAVIGGLFVLYSTRFVVKATILDARAMRLTTPRLFGYKQEIYPLSEVYARKPLYVGKGEHGLGDSSNYYLRVLGKRLAYVLEHRGKFDHPKTYDQLFHKPGLGADGKAKAKK